MTWFKPIHPIRTGRAYPSEAYHAGSNKGSFSAGKRYSSPDGEPTHKKEKGRAMKRISPCKDCKERCTGCHGRCQPYKEWAEEVKKITRKSCEIKEILCYSTAGKSRNLKKKWRQSTGRRGGTSKAPKAP